MPRQPRILAESGIYHIVTRGNNRQALFRQKADYLHFLSTLRKLKSEHSFDLYHYCLMTNHVHLVMRFHDSKSLPKVMQRVNLIYAKRFRKLNAYCGHVFQDRFKSFPIENDSYLLECGRYVERNPLNAGVVARLDDYPWSSYAFYACGEENTLLTPNLLYEELGSTPQERQENYRAYVAEARPYEKFVYEGLLRS